MFKKKKKDKDTSNVTIRPMSEYGQGSIVNDIVTQGFGLNDEKILEVSKTIGGPVGELIGRRAKKRQQKRDYQQFFEEERMRYKIRKELEEQDRTR